MKETGRADLHVHTTASDGTLKPAEVVAEAGAAKLAAVGITDHDAIDGVGPAIEAAQALDLLVVPGIEINTDYEKEEIHILGYFINVDSESLLGHLAHLRASRVERLERMVKKLNSIGVRISLERVLEISGEGAVGRPHVARAIVEAGHAPGVGAAFGRYLVRGAPGHVPRYKITPFEAVDIIRKAGGVAVFGHPGNSHRDELIPRLVEHGLQGIEVYHIDHNREQSKHYLAIARRYGLVGTGGSDSHGPNAMKSVEIGQVTCDISAVERLRSLSSSQVSRRQTSSRDSASVPPSA